MLTANQVAPSVMIGGSIPIRAQVQHAGHALTIALLPPALRGKAAPGPASLATARQSLRMRPVPLSGQLWLGSKSFHHHTLYLIFIIRVYWYIDALLHFSLARAPAERPATQAMFASRTISSGLANHSLAFRITQLGLLRLDCRNQLSQPASRGANRRIILYFPIVEVIAI